MECRSLPFRQLPHQSKLFLQFLDHFPAVKQFYGHPPSFDSVKEEARYLEYPSARRASIAAILNEQNAVLGAGEPARKNLARFANGAVAVVSGQQVGLFGGPAYSLYKAASAIQIARELTRAGVDAVPIFWMATEDHDLDEVRTSTWFHKGNLLHLELPGNGDAGLPVGKIALGPEIQPLLEHAAAILEEAGGGLLAGILRESFSPQETYGTAFGKLFARLFAEHGLILLDPLDARLHRAGADILVKAAADRDSLVEALLSRGKELDKAGYAAQVKVTSRSTLLFKLGSGLREPISFSGGKFVAGQRSWSRAELAEAVHAEPEEFSPNALLRPVLQDYLLPTAAYIGGAAEIAYFAQAEVLYKKLLGRMPVVLPRAAYTFLDAKPEKLLKRYELSVEDVWRGSQELRRAMEAANVPKTLARNLDKTRKEAERALDKLKKQIVRLDATLGGAVETTRKKIVFQLEKLKRKAGKAQALKESLLDGHQHFLESWFYPHKALQERELCFLPLLAKLGPEGLNDLLKLSGSEALDAHKIVRLP
ncbi:MAG TPA: bacillithiol biosynthesis cysteine-adding enzyme BshC [Candidatus Acidoferrum sp.]|nr:bacillithiol biosynthesis cysteine-adding enzyme BshC [Candidatus Acidoferrum sp.]